MASPKTPKTSLNAAAIARCLDTLVEGIGPFDFGVDADDFILYELNRLIEEERASFEDEEFRILIDEGIRIHVEENLPIRCQMAYSLRAQLGGKEPDATMREVLNRVIRALENTDSDLRNAAFVVRKYTAYLFDRLQSIENMPQGETEARETIEGWKSGAIPRQKMIAGLQQMGRGALGPASELLLNSLEDRDAVETALSILPHVRSSVSARVLAFVVSEPMLDEDLEARAYSSLREFWPLARPYILHSLHLHAHEDLPFRWFQLLIETEEAAAAELIYEEMRAHGNQPNHHEDLWALASLMTHSRDPEITDKVFEWINSPNTPQSVAPMLQEFLKEYRRPDPKPDVPDPWAERARSRIVNEKYVAASRLFDAGRVEDANQALDKILLEEPNYPFASMLKSLSTLYKN
jgi:hypothetical protein